MQTIETVTGKMDASRLGHFQPHEHLIVTPGPGTAAQPALLLNDPALSLAELRDYRRLGGGGLLDAQPIGAGRDARMLRAISLESFVPIIAVTGYHAPFFYDAEHFILNESEARLEARFAKELAEGLLELPEAKAGAVKAAIGEMPLTGREGIKLRAAARAAAGADVALVLHTDKGRQAARAVSICEGVGLSPSRVLICHVDRQASDFAPHDEAAKTGAYLEYDTIGRFKYHDDESEIALVLRMLEKGFGRRLLFSLDTTARRLKSYGGEIGLTYLLTDFLPALRKRGVSEDVIRAITIENPARAFGK